MGHFDRFMSQPVENALTELENVANYTLHRNTLSPTTAVQLPEVPTATYFPAQPPVSDTWDSGTSPFEHPHERYVAGPIASPFEMQFPLPNQPPFQLAPPYDYSTTIPAAMMFQYPRADSGPSVLQHHSQPLPQSTTSRVVPEQRLPPSPHQQGFVRPPWGEVFPTDFSASTAQSQHGYEGQETWSGSGGHTTPQQSVTRPPRGRHQKRPSRSRGPHHH
jgi:hypothetical protein